MLGPKLIEAPGECRSNHDVICGLAKRVGAEHDGFNMTPRELIDWSVKASGWGDLQRLERENWIDCQPDFDTSHYLGGFAHPDEKFHFRPDWASVVLPTNVGPKGPTPDMPELPDHWDVIEDIDEDHPFRLVTAPARNYLNSSFNETPTSLAKQGAPTAMMHPDDMAKCGLSDGDAIAMGNERGEVALVAETYDGVRPGVVIVEGINPNDQFPNGEGINTLTGCDQVAPIGGAAFHDNHVWIRGA